MRARLKKAVKAVKRAKAKVKAKLQAKVKAKAKATAKVEAKAKAKKTAARIQQGPPRGAAQRAAEVDVRLGRVMPVPRTDLDFASPWQLLIATMLSAQANDKTINRITPELFRRFPTPEALGAADQGEVETIVRSSGYYRSKAKAIREASLALDQRFGGEVPRTLDELVTLPGVARKTANVVLAAAYGIPSGIVVDTHAMRVSQRLGLTTEEEPAKIEQDLLALFPTESWIEIGLGFVLHGRYLCTARAPRCEICPLNETCPSAAAAPMGEWIERAEQEKQILDNRGEPPEPETPDA